MLCCCPGCFVHGFFFFFPRSCLAASRASTEREQRVQSCPCSLFAPCCSPGRISVPRATGAAGLGTQGWSRACPAPPFLARFPPLQGQPLPKADFFLLQRGRILENSHSISSRARLCPSAAGWGGSASSADGVCWLCRSLFEMFLCPGFHHKPCCQSPVGE